MNLAPKGSDVRNSFLEPCRSDSRGSVPLSDGRVAGVPLALKDDETPEFSTSGPPGDGISTLRCWR